MCVCGGSNAVTSRKGASQGCNNTLAKTTKGNHCRKCYLKQPHPPQVNDEENNPFKVFNHIQQAFDAIGLDMIGGNMNQLKVGDLLTVIRKEIAPLVDVIINLQNKVHLLETKVEKIEEERDDHVGKLKTLSDNVESFKQIIMEQQKYLESLKSKEISSNIIVSGIPNESLVINDEEADDDAKKLDVIFNHMNCNEKLNGEHKVTSLPIREGATTHSVKIQLANAEDVKHVINKAKELKNFTTAKVYVNYDETYYIRKENNRLRKKRSDLKIDHVNDEIKISKGKLYHNNIVVDQFDLSNQLF